MGEQREVVNRVEAACRWTSSLSYIGKMKIQHQVESRLRTGEASTLVDEKLGASGTSEGTKTAGEIGCASVCGGACG